MRPQDWDLKETSLRIFPLPHWDLAPLQGPAERAKAYPGVPGLHKGWAEESGSRKGWSQKPEGPGARP